MNAKKAETAEQKLLKMLEATSSSPTEEVKKEKEISKQHRLLFNIKFLNYIFIFLIFAGTYFLGKELLASTQLSSQGYDISVKKGITKNRMFSGDIVPAPQRESYYIAIMNKRNIFQPFELEIEEDHPLNPRVSNITKRIKKYKLVGTSWLDSVESASIMIEDTEKKETHFVQKGSEIGDSNIIVKTIYADSALLGYNDEEKLITYDESKK